MKLLQNLNVLITRPIQQSQELANAIAHHGGNPILFPTIEIQDIDTSLLADSIKKNLAFADKIIFVSANAAIRFTRLNIDLPKQASILAIGSATANVLKQQHRVDFFPSKTTNSEALLSSALLTSVKGETIVIFSGEGGRSLLATTLLARGARVIKIAVYRRICPNSSDEQLALLNNTCQESPFIISCYSAETLKNLYHILKNRKQVDWLQNKFLLVISPRIARYAKLFGFKREQIIHAENASTSAIIETLISWYAKFRNNRNLSKDSINDRS